MPINGARLPLAPPGGGFGTAHLLYDFGGQIIGAHTAVFCGGQNRVGILGLAVVVLAGLAVGGQVVDPGIVHPGGGENGSPSPALVCLELYAVDSNWKICFSSKKLRGSI